MYGWCCGGQIPNHRLSRDEPVALHPLGPELEPALEEVLVMLLVNMGQDSQ